MKLRLLSTIVCVTALTGCDTLSLSGEGRALERDMAVQYEQAWDAAQKVLKRYFSLVRADVRTGQVVALTLPSAAVVPKTRQRIVAELVDNRDGWYEVEVRVMNQIEASNADPFSKRQSTYLWKTIDFDEVLETKLVEEIYREIEGEEVARRAPRADPSPSREKDIVSPSRAVPTPVTQPKAYTSRKGPRSHLAFVTRKASIRDPFIRALLLGDMHFKEGNFEGAEEQYLIAQKRKPGSAVPMLAIGHARFAMRDYAGAAKGLRSGLAAYGKLSSLSMDRRDFYAEPKTFYAHLAALEKFVEQHPDDSNAFFVLGYNYYFSERSSLSKEAFERTLELQPNDPQSREFLKLLGKDPVI